jgi:hypothetical protein
MIPAHKPCRIDANDVLRSRTRSAMAQNCHSNDRSIVECRENFSRKRATARSVLRAGRVRGHQFRRADPGDDEADRRDTGTDRDGQKPCGNGSDARSDRQ